MTMTPTELALFQNRLARLVGTEPHMLLIRRKDRTDIMTNVTSPPTDVAAWLRSIADQIENQNRTVILPG